MPRPHGGKLINLLTTATKIDQRIEESRSLEKIQVSTESRLDLENIANGLYSPLKGPLTSNNYNAVLSKGRLSNDIPWTIPILLDVSEKESEKFSEGDTIALSSKSTAFAMVKVDEKYSWNKKEYCDQIFKTYDPEHPGVNKVNNMNPVLVGGEIEVFMETPGVYPQYRLRPDETRFLFKEKGWRTVAGFQTRNAPHMGHEYVQKTALSFVDGLFINPLIGKKKVGDFTDVVILESYEALIKHYFLKNSATLVTLEMEMRYAGPKEAIHHSIVRKNYGCSHFIVGRDHAGVGNYYGPFEAQEIFESYPDLGIAPIFFRNFFHCHKCGGPQNDKICPHGEEDRENYKGRVMRQLLSEGEQPDPLQMRPEVTAAILRHKNPFVE
jgi:sulfate adenylyltransferase